MKKSDELKQKLATLEAANKDLVSKESRTVEENTEVDNYISAREALQAEIERELKLERINAANAAAAGQSQSEKETREIGSYSFHRAIKLLGEGRNVDGLEGEMAQEGAKERTSLGIATKGFAIPLMVLQAGKRASTGQNITTAADGGNWVDTDPVVFIEALKNAMVINQLGATFLTGLVGNLPLVKNGAFSASWIAEGSDVTTTKAALSKATLTPKNLMVAGAISKQLLVQTAGVAETLVRNELIAAMAQGLQSAAINGAGGTAPTGILNTVGIGAVAGGTDGLIPTWGNVVDLESEVAIDNAVFMNPGYLTNAKVRGKLKQTLKANGVSGYIWDGEGVNGYKAHVTNGVPSNLVKGGSGAVCSAIIFGYFSELFIGMWGGLDLVVDPYTLKKRNELEIVFNQFADVALRNPESFAAMKDALTV
jgi:HK97 family phage major capsid protein